MTPDQARALLDGTTPGPWFFDNAIDGRVLKVGPIAPYGYELECSTDDAALAAAAPTLAAIVAEMHEEWGVEWPADEDGTPQTTWGMPDREYAESYARYLRNDPHRLLGGVDPSAIHVVRRYITEQEKIT